MRRWCWINATPFYQFCWTYNFIIVKPFNGNDSFSGETGNAVFNRRRKQVSKNSFFLLFRANTLYWWNGMDQYIGNTWITLYFSSNTTQLEIIQCNLLFRRKYIMRIFFLMSLFSFPRLNAYASWNKLNWKTKAR